jgi:mRNA interferase MazF
MPLPHTQRGQLWVVDLGYLGKVRPALIVGIPFRDNERTLCLIVPHTTSLLGTRFEVAVTHAALGEGAFDVQQTTAVAAIKLVRRLGALRPEDMRKVETVLAHALGLRPANDFGTS